MQIPVADIGITTGMQMTYSDDLQMTVVHAGSETWGWDGKIMTKVASGGPPGANIALGYDLNRKVVIAYGGINSDNSLSSALWELKKGHWTKVSDNGIWKNAGNGKYERVNTAIQK